MRQTVKQTGTVYLVGAGPGAPDLLTLRAAYLLEAADVVFHDALVHPDTIALAARAEKITVGKRHGRYSAAQQFINKSLIGAARKYRTVVRLKGGDPMLFGRAQEEIDALAAAGVACVVVPGITAALAASADLGVSLTRRGISRSVAIATPRVGREEQPSDWAASLMNADTGVLYMAAHQASDISAQLVARGKSAATPVMVVENASMAGLRHCTTLGGLAQNGLPQLQGPALLMMGEVYRAALAAAEVTHEGTGTAGALKQRC
jgi:uroporphyrin-III C-methyltransferase